MLDKNHRTLLHSILLISDDESFPKRETFKKSMSQQIMLGQQITASFQGCHGERFSDCGRLLGLLRQVVTLLGFDEVAHLSHTFTPYGSTCVLVLAQSHIIAHTWPEYHTLVIDLFACGDINFTPAAQLVQTAVNADSYAVEERTRNVDVETQEMNGSGFMAVPK